MRKRDPRGIAISVWLFTSGILERWFVLVPGGLLAIDPVVLSICPAKGCRGRVDISVEDLDEAMRVLPRDFGKLSPSKPLWL